MAQEPQFHAVSGGIRLAISPDQPHLMLLEVKTRQGPVRLSMTKEEAKRFAEAIAQAAVNVAPDS